MTLTDIVHYLEPVGLVGFIIILGSLIKITPLLINIWAWMARKLGNALNHDMMDKINSISQRQAEIEKKLDDHIKENEVDSILRSRKAILDFAREIVSGEKHTRELYLECLLYIDMYEKYCKENPDFPNNRAVMAIQMVKDNYLERLTKADFLAEEYRKPKRLNKEQ